MIVASTKEELLATIVGMETRGGSLGFVPTMGALHEGHLELVRRSVKENKYTVVSIFVNPVQFNDPSDYAKYPRTMDSDIDKLKHVMGENDVVFCPMKDEMLSSMKPVSVDIGRLDSLMEGAHRPGHFKGVVQVVEALFRLVRPDFSYFGKKDYQQLQVIQSMVKQLSLPVIIVPCDTVREPDGLAMSSRNQRLTEYERAIAPAIYKTLSHIRLLSIDKKQTRFLVRSGQDFLANTPEIEIEYLDIVDANTLEPIDFIDRKSVVCIAVRLGAVRLIDNIEIIP